MRHKNTFTRDDLIKMLKGEIISLTNREKGFLITCLMTAASESFRCSPRFNTKRDPESGIKYDGIPKSEIIKLLEKLGGDEDDLEELLGHM